MSENFVSAFDSIASVVEQAAQLPDHRERPRPPLVVTQASPEHEVTVTVTEGKVSAIELKQFWFEDAESSTVADLVTVTVNDALEEWSRQQLDHIMSVTPEMRELSAAIKAARDELDDAWIKTLADAKVPAP